MAGGFPGIICTVSRSSQAPISRTDGDPAVDSLLGDLTLALVFYIQVQIQLAVPDDQTERAVDGENQSGHQTTEYPSVLMVSPPR